MYLKIFEITVHDSMLNVRIRPHPQETCVEFCGYFLFA